MPKSSHIYAFIQRNPRVRATDRLFYVGSSNQLHIRIEQHVDAMLGAINLERPQEVYRFINTYVGIDKFEVLIIDNDVSAGQEKTLERVYFNLLVAQGYVLQNSNKPIPEDFDAISDFRVVNKASVKLSDFISRVFGDPECCDVVKLDDVMSFTETTLNKVRKQQVSIHRVKSRDVGAPKGGDDEIAQLRTKLNELSTLNSKLSGENSKLKTLLNNQTSIGHGTHQSNRPKKHITTTAKYCDLCKLSFSSTNFSKHYKICSEKHGKSPEQLLMKIDQMKKEINDLKSQ